MHSRIRDLVQGRSLTLAVTLCVALLCGCSHPATSGGAPLSSPEPPPEHRAALSAADDLLRRGCYDCLVEAWTRYESLQTDASLGSPAIDVGCQAGGSHPTTPGALA